MTLKDVVKLLNAEVIVCEDGLDVEVKTAFAADLLSDVLAYAKEGTLLITGITNPQVIRTAEMLELIGILVVRGKNPDEETVKLAQTKGIPLMVTRYIMFESCGRLYQNGVVGCVESVPNARS
ncbi:MAG: DRTGG domain-containing protein [Proteobacteria bacterium]|nr:DRTGG domain-containing protein [Pseudomonadota bacterium]